MPWSRVWVLSKGDRQKPLEGFNLTSIQAGSTPSYKECLTRYFTTVFYTENTVNRLHHIQNILHIFHTINHTSLVRTKK